jgi:hypothetical protein
VAEGRTECAICHSVRPLGAHCKHCGQPPHRREPDLSETEREWYYSERADHDEILRQSASAATKLRDTLRGWFPDA